MTGEDGIRPIAPLDPADDDNLVAELAATVEALRRQVSTLSVGLERTKNTADRAVQGLDDLEDQLSAAADGIEAAAGLRLVGEDSTQDQADGDPESSKGAGKSDEETPEPLDMDVLYDWVNENISEWAQRKTVTGSGSSGTRWCPEWFEHPEAISRLWALRRSWMEFVVQPGSAMTVYFRDYFDTTMDRLTGESGPFCVCSLAGHTDSAKFLVQSAPPWRSAPIRLAE